VRTKPEKLVAQGMEDMLLTMGGAIKDHMRTLHRIREDGGGDFSLKCEPMQRPRGKKAQGGFHAYLIASNHVYC